MSLRTGDIYGQSVGLVYGARINTGDYLGLLIRNRVTKKCTEQVGPVDLSRKIQGPETVGQPQGSASAGQGLFALADAGGQYLRTLLVLVLPISLSPHPHSHLPSLCLLLHTSKATELFSVRALCLSRLSKRRPVPQRPPPTLRVPRGLLPRRRKSASTRTLATMRKKPLVSACIERVDTRLPNFYRRKGRHGSGTLAPE